ncbi:MAG TPA: hypothetical protein IAC57_05690 [Candidatus Scatosoma pullistercoris]|uniref:Uncharacterized protein n=1 Tax=Candidatus Scatosoma pullistercoris TaxID=2840934 RepID=A0A9D1MG68_9FIRM|nr:hypothetical protein [Candidatus Scatosoma pullistercoris]
MKQQKEKQLSPGVRRRLFLLKKRKYKKGDIKNGKQAYLGVLRRTDSKNPT